MKIIKDSVPVSIRNIRSKQMVMETLLIGSSISTRRTRDPLPSRRNGYFSLPFFFFLFTTLLADELSLILLSLSVTKAPVFLALICMFCFDLFDSWVNNCRGGTVLSETHGTMNSSIFDHYFNIFIPLESDMNH